jgi:hypothetical protein
MKYSTSHVTISSAHLNTYYRKSKHPKQFHTAPKKKRKSKGKETDSSDDERSGPPITKSKPTIKLKESYVLQVADLATLEGLCPLIRNIIHRVLMY